MPPDGAYVRTSLSLPRTMVGDGSFGRFFGAGVLSGDEAGRADAGFDFGGFGAFGTEAGFTVADAAVVTDGSDAAYGENDGDFAATDAGSVTAAGGCVPSIIGRPESSVTDAAAATAAASAPGSMRSTR